MTTEMEMKYYDFGENQFYLTLVAEI